MTLAGYAGLRQRRRWDSNPWLYAHHRTHVRVTVHFLACFNRFTIFFCHLVRTCMRGNVPWCTNMQHEMQHEIKMIQYSLKAGGCILSAFYFFGDATYFMRDCQKLPRSSIARIPIMLYYLFATRGMGNLWFDMIDRRCNGVGRFILYIRASKRYYWKNW